jgi:hypothetical protein
MRRSFLAVAVALLVLALPTAASAATRYAAQGGGVVPGCMQASPCSLEYAITGANSGDEVVVTPGTYDVAATISTENPLFIHGQEGGPRPRIVAASGVTPFKSFAPQRLGYLMFEAQDSIDGVLFLPADGTALERLELIARGENALALRAGNEFTLVDSLLWAGESTDATGLFLQGTDSGFPTLRNDTIIARGGGSVGISIFVAGENAAISMLAVNVIAGAETDASATVSPERTKSSVAIHFDHSNLDSTVGNVISAAGQTAPPQFVAAGPPTFEQALGSPTIDAGANETANGAVDLAGNPRSLPGSRGCDSTPPAVTDIGAYEFVPATPTCVSFKPAVPPDTRITRFKPHQRRAAFYFIATGGTGPAGFECKLDRKPFRACRSPRVYENLKRGRHVFRVRANAGGLTDPTPAKRKFRVGPKHRHRHHHRFPSLTPK